MSIQRLDHDSPAYKRELAAVAVIVTVLTLTGGLWLGSKIASAEERIEQRKQAAEQAPETERAPETPARERIVR